MIGKYVAAIPLPIVLRTWGKFFSRHVCHFLGVLTSIRNNLTGRAWTDVQAEVGEFVCFFVSRLA